MGMDIHGSDPTSARGEYFGINWLWWHPLADYCVMCAPDTWAACGHWDRGDGLDAAGAVALAETLQKEVDAGRTESYARRYASEQELMPDEPCATCAGTGVRKPEPHCGAGDPKESGIKCNWCQGAGYRRPRATNRSFSTQNVAAFAAFLRESGGFSIW
jgi:hypothetical protein